MSTKRKSPKKNKNKDSCPRPLTADMIQPDDEVGKTVVTYSEGYFDEQGCNVVYDMYLSRESKIWCGTGPIPIKWPLYWCHPNKCRKYAYVTVLYPDGQGKLSYLDGALGVALGLRKQGTDADILCMITTDVKQEDIAKLALVYDEVITVPYITPSPKLLNNELAIWISPEIYEGCDWFKKYGFDHPYNHVFTKLHMLRLTRYEKVALVDLDIIPICNYDSIFSNNTPSGILESPRSGMISEYQSEQYKNGCNEGVKLGDRIPAYLTDIDTETGSDINAGLLLVSPNEQEFYDIINELQKPRSEWFDKKGLRIQNTDGTYLNFFCYPEQNYLTKKWSGNWYNLSFSYATWGEETDIAFGVHFAGFFGLKYWMAQPVGYLIYNQEQKKQLGHVELSFSEYNKICIWTLENYPEMKYILLRDLVFYGAYRTYVVGKECNSVHLYAQYPKLTDADMLHWSQLKAGKGNDAIRELLAPDQKMLVDMLE